MLLRKVSNFSYLVTATTITMVLVLGMIIESDCSPAVASSTSSTTYRQSSGKTKKGTESSVKESEPSENKSEMGPVSNFSMEEIVKQLITASHAVEHLEKMKNRLLVQFENKTSEFATARAGYGGYGAYGFPSLEGALLSLAFLTFAVFLIDLIQQLLSRFRTGTAGVVPLVGRRKRGVFPQDDYEEYHPSLVSSVLKAIETPLHFFK